MSVLHQPIKNTEVTRNVLVSRDALPIEQHVTQEQTIVLLSGELTITTSVKPFRPNKQHAGHYIGVAPLRVARLHAGNNYTIATARWHAVFNTGDEPAVFFSIYRTTTTTTAAPEEEEARLRELYNADPSLDALRRLQQLRK